MLGHKNPGSLTAIGKGNILVKQFLTSGIRKNIGQDSRELHLKYIHHLVIKLQASHLSFLGFWFLEAKLDWMNSKMLRISEILGLDLIQTIIQLYCVLEWDNSLASIFPLSLQVVLRRLARECYDPIISYLYLHEQQKPDYLMFHVMHSCKKENKQGFPGFIGLVLNTLVCVCEIFNETVKECTKKSSLKFKLFSCWHFKP